MMTRHHPETMKKEKPQITQVFFVFFSCFSRVSWIIFIAVPHDTAPRGYLINALAMASDMVNPRSRSSIPHSPVGFTSRNIYFPPGVSMTSRAPK
jgi:hypothetical protein